MSEYNLTIFDLVEGEEYVMERFPLRCKRENGKLYYYYTTELKWLPAPNHRYASEFKLVKENEMKKLIEFEVGDSIPEGAVFIEKKKVKTGSRDVEYEGLFTVKTYRYSTYKEVYVYEVKGE